MFYLPKLFVGNNLIDKINHQNDISDVPVCLQLGQGRITTRVGRPPGTVPAGLSHSPSRHLLLLMVSYFPLRGLCH